MRGVIIIPSFQCVPDRGHTSELKNPKGRMGIRKIRVFWVKQDEISGVFNARGYFSGWYVIYMVMQI